MSLAIEKVVISAPWGNWLHFPGCTSTLGTFTLKYRGGLLWRAWRCLLTLRYSWRMQGYVNKLGLPNPGIGSLKEDCSGQIVSIHGFDADEWPELVFRLVQHRLHAVELNLSCPNISHAATVAEVAEAVELLVRTNLTVIAKLPPVRWMDFAVPLWEIGVRHFHLCNTLPTPGGGLSGKPLKQLSLWAVEEVKQKWGEQVCVIGGGGITSTADVLDYRRAGADRIALGSMLLNPFNWRKIPAIVEAMESVALKETR